MMKARKKWMLRWMCDHRRSDKSINDCIREKIQVAHVEDKMREAALEMIWSCLALTIKCTDP